jgi:hypothetical protein
MNDEEMKKIYRIKTNPKQKQSLRKQENENSWEW